MGTYAYSGNQNKQRDNHADEYLPDLLNDIQDEIEIVEQVLSGGEEGQVLTADSNGKAQWAEASGGGGVIYDGIEETHEYDGDEEAIKINLTLTLNGEPINDDSFVMYKTSNNQLGFSSSDTYIEDYTQTRKFVYVNAPLGPGRLYVKFYLPSGATMVFLIYDVSGNPG